MEWVLREAMGPPHLPIFAAVPGMQGPLAGPFLGIMFAMNNPED